MSDHIPEGYILLARKIRKSSLWHSLKASHRIVMIELLLQAQFQDGDVVRNGEIIYLKRGQVATSYQMLADDIGDKEITVKVIRGAINKLEKYGFLAKDEAKVRAKKGLLLTINNYCNYQNPENYKGKDKGNDEGKEGAKQGQSKGKARAINNNVNNANNSNNGNNGKRPSSPKQVYDEQSIPYKLAFRLYQNILTNNPDYKKPNLQSWANDVRLMMERDDRTEEQIIYLMDWCQKDSFWKSNILSTSKLREKFDQLVIRVKEDIKKQNKQAAPNEMPRAYQSLQDWADEDESERNY